MSNETWQGKARRMAQLVDNNVKQSSDDYTICSDFLLTLFVLGLPIAITTKACDFNASKKFLKTDSTWAS